MKTLGILGGVGPQTTSRVYLSVINLIRNNGSDKYPPIIIYNLPFPFAVEREAIIDGVNSEKMIPYLVEGAKILERSGANFGILPCNTLHKFIDDIRASVKIPFLSILEETLAEILSNKIKKVGVLATETTVKDKIYEEFLSKEGIEVLYPTRSEQDEINKIITGLIKEEQDNSFGQNIEAICESLSNKGVESILLACTDLQLAAKGIRSPVPLIDTTDILIKASLRELSQ